MLKFNLLSFKLELQIIKNIKYSLKMKTTPMNPNLEDFFFKFAQISEFKGLIVRLCGKIEEGNKIHKYTKRFTSEKFKNIRKSRFILIF
jgi:hypothetical protein